MAIKTTIIGATGRMGRMLVRLVNEDPGLELVAALEYEGSPFIGQDAGVVAGMVPCAVPITSDYDEAIAKTEAIIDFSCREVTMALARKVAGKSISLVIGTTGLTDEQKSELRQIAAQGSKIVQAPNMSVGVNVLFALTEQVAKLLGDDYDIEIVEMHHNKKKDAPSGTAERLGEIAAAARQLSYQNDTRHGRVGMVGERTKNEIGMHSLRGGDVVGDHTVIFATGGERIELTHKASGRETFAKGAVRAVHFLNEASAGFYDMQDVLGLRK